MRNTYIDGTIETAKQRRCDIIQLKYDGHWCRMVSDGHGEQIYFSDTDKIFGQGTNETLPSCVLIGEMMRGTQWAQDPSRKGNFFVWDVWELNGVPLGDTYKRRYVRLRSEVMPRAPKNFVLAPLFKLSDRQAVWQKYVEEEGYEGIVYRWSEGLNDHPIVREKKQFTLNAVVLAVIPGEGKHSGKMGALKVMLDDKTTTLIGNGYGDALREAVSICPADYIGRTMEFTCNAVFESGNVRHGRFVRWRDDR